MLMFKKCLAMAMVTVMTVTALAGCGSSSSSTTTTTETSTTDSGEVVQLSFAVVTNESSKIAAQKMKEMIEEKSNGTLIINVFPDNMLGDDRVAFETTQFGDIDMAMSATSPLATMYTDFYAYDAPFLFLGREDANTKLDGEAGVAMLDGLADLGLKGLGYWENGFRNFTNNKVAVKVPADVKGMKVRVMENEIHLAAWNAFGANPTPMAFTEVFTALQQGTIDAQENPFSIIDANKFYEVQQYISTTQHGYSPHLVFMNMDKFNSLSAEHQTILLESFDEATDIQRSESERIENEIIERMIADGITIVELTDEERAQWQQVMVDADIYGMVESKMANPELLQTLLG